MGWLLTEGHITASELSEREDKVYVPRHLQHQWRAYETIHGRRAASSRGEHFERGHVLATNPTPRQTI